MVALNKLRITAVSHPIFALLPLVVGGLAATRLLYELLFPRWLWLARPFPAMLLALLFAGAAWLLIRRTLPAKSGAAWLPLFLNLIYLLQPDVNLVNGRFLFAMTIWLAVVLLVLPDTSHPRREGVLLLWLLLAPIYLLTMSTAVGRADTFEFQVVAPQLGIAHPTGYPLYLLLGKLWTLLIPLGSVAWRLNVGTAVYALLATTLLYLTGLRLLRQPIPALLGAITLGITPTFWSQAIAAEVYSLHALIVSSVLLLALHLLPTQLAKNSQQPAAAERQQITDQQLPGKMMRDWRPLAMVFLVGLGLTNHLTSVFLLPTAGLALLFIGAISQQKSLRSNLRSLFTFALFFLLPLTLYAYLPLRWAALHDEGMGFGRFLDWVIGGRFQDALQWAAWLHDPTRYAIIGRLLVDNWGALNLALAAIGLLYLAIRHWRAALLLFLAWFGFSFYALNYYVPDLAVFLMGAHVVLTLWWMAGAAALLHISSVAVRTAIPTLQAAVYTLLFMPALLLSMTTWPLVDQAQDDGLMQWGTAVLDLPLAANAAILADSEKIAPLYYLQQAEGVRPDLDIMVLPDEAAYRAELDKRIAAGQTVYLARFLPGLEGIYHLRAFGPLTEVSPKPLTQLPPTATPTTLSWQGVELAGYVLASASPYGARETAVTLYWQTSQPITQSLYVYVRWQGQAPLNASGQHAAHNNYPTLAWDAGELVSDFYRLPHPVSPVAQTLALQVALAPPFTPAAALPWETVTTVNVPATAALTLPHSLRAQVGAGTMLSGAQFAATIRPQTPLPVTLTGFGDPAAIQLSLLPLTAANGDEGVTNSQSPVANLSPFATTLSLDTDMGNGRYALVVQTDSAARCGWLRPLSRGCVLGEVTVNGAPLPAGATNFDDKIALLDVAIPDTTLQPGGLLHLTLTWQALAAIPADYTVFVQILDSDDRIVGQVDAWPVQGTRPTSQWTPGEMVTDPYVVQLSGEMPPGQYRLIVGWYLLADLRRLPVLDEAGAPIDDKFLVPGLAVAGALTP
ncbi:MAG: DUF2723 domain-containing protein [Ardenticatenaceae bacterium]|nr:DUF2723 domain-containing protein [Ardenticatenaceae bacterium]